jgi:cytochrome b6-f complex iron-sulfur subunit
VDRRYDVKRRRFLKVILAFLGSITAFSFVFSILKFLTVLPARAADAKKLTIRKSEVPSGEAKNIIYQNEAAVLINRPDKGFIALSRTCTHLGCLVEFSKTRQELICPCHAGTYDLEGNVMSGPPPKPLTIIPLKIEGDTIIIG